MSFEDDLRATMRAHEDEAPTGLALPARRRRVWLPAAAAAAVVLLAVALSVALGRHDERNHATGPTSPLSCPAKVGQGTAVPPAPDDIAPRDRLVPDRTPSSVVVCSYVRPGGAGPAVASSRVLTRDLTAVRDTLAFVPRGVNAGCLAYLAITDGDQYLIGLMYPSGTVWVAAPRDHCAGSSNGTFDSFVNLNEFARAAASAGHWVTDPTPAKERGGCSPIGAGRRGEDTSLVPGRPTGLVVCSSLGRKSDVVRVRTDFGALVAALRRTPTRPETNTCRGEAKATDYALRFTYARGPDLVVFLDGSCRPNLGNSSLQGDDAGGRVLAQVTRLLAAN